MTRFPLAFALAVSPFALAASATAQTEQARYADRARDHAAIMAMAGTFKVTFDMRETTPLVAGYTPYPAKLSGGHEVVRAIVDTPDHIVLQHLLVVGDGNGQTMVVKHWRQDWTYQPASVLTYVAPGRWRLRPVAERERRGAWSQTVWQTDDSPRYGAIGRWRYDDGATRWTSEETRRPLARRDATRGVPYDHYLGTNRHVLTPSGWVHEQDNAKIGSKDGRATTFVHEYVVNTYVPATDFRTAAADDYWARTRDYWATVRAAWDARIAAQDGLTLGEVADTGSVTAHELMLLADDIRSGEATTASAAEQAKALIRKD
ncbi:DUF6607 family protein [Sphingomonas carotinifaciens]|uniref:Uncharacterized protein n=1 Tax=Sphingomonas carotinifaciens TaxID=1166323 RepID=A0A1G7M5D0_9SPHN|nr:DUF6607 family protein [Sphingomonas carotinifaciens]MBB4088075.1 hypothetical protein [Sphingomonas carotinifaciens]MWC45016.1 hypothetical protein [Sphingomonas carotinifaciens]SDF56923.1 hypothetical protein SAMN05216557_10476 [Sphingomonas carotinifaciens]